jgi:quercetin dioxygenase-like cupin family protein
MHNMPGRPRFGTCILRRVLAAAAAVCVAAVLTFAQSTSNEQAFTITADDTGLEWQPCPDFMPAGCRIAVVQGNATEQNADVLFRLPGNTTAPRHRHTSAERMVLLSGEMRIDADDQPGMLLREGTYAYMPAGLPHSATCESADPCTLFIAFEDPVDAVAVDED